MAGNRTEVCNRYNKANSVIVPVRLNYKTDADILEALATKDSKAGYIKSLIRENIKGAS